MCFAYMYKFINLTVGYQCNTVANIKRTLNIPVNTLNLAFYFRYHRRDRDATNFEKKLLAAEAQVNDLQARLGDAVSQRKHWETEYNVSCS